MSDALRGASALPFPTGPKMNDTSAKGPDYSKSLYLPQTQFPMRAGLPQKEQEILARWQAMDLYKLMRENGRGRPKFVLHDGPPYANGNIHIGHALNKILKDMVCRSQAMLGKDSNYVPGWDCHGLPIEWKIEEDNYRSKGKPKPELSDSAAMISKMQSAPIARLSYTCQGSSMKSLRRTGRLTAARAACRWAVLP